MAKPKRPRADAAAAEPITAEGVAELATRYNLAEIEVEQDGLRIRIVREHAPAATAVSYRGEAPAAAAQAQAADSSDDAGLTPIEAPMVGTFYRAPSPSAAPFVSVGDVVREGQVLCIIEAMKLMNEIEAKSAGRVARILVENGQPVEYGQPLFMLEPR